MIGIILFIDEKALKLLLLKLKLLKRPVIKAGPLNKRKLDLNLTTSKSYEIKLNKIKTFERRLMLYLPLTRHKACTEELVRCGFTNLKHD